MKDPLRVLLVEDDPDAARIVARGLAEQSYLVDVANDGQTALSQVARVAYDAVVLDVLLPEIDGFVVCRTLRRQGATVPILMVTARDDVEARIQGLDCGADGYLVKPYDFGEFLARLRAVVRRRHEPIAPDLIRVGPLVIDTRSMSARIHDANLGLTTREYALLEYLSRHAGALLGRAEIAQHVWDERYDPLSNLVDVYIMRLRRKLANRGALDDPGAPRFWLSTRLGSKLTVQSRALSGI